MILEKYSDVKSLIREGDVLLYRGTGWFSFLVRAYGESRYTHCGLASWWNGDANTSYGILESVEFREGSFLSGLFGSSGGGGGRSINLDREIKKYSGKIDVYRPTQNFGYHKFDPIKKTTEYSKISFDGRAVTRTLRHMTGLPYGWKKVWFVAKYRLFCLGLYNNYEALMNDSVQEIIYPVCSSVLAYAFNSNNFDLIKNKSDDWTSPGDIANSPRLSYLFTLVE